MNFAIRKGWGPAVVMAVVAIVLFMPADAVTEVVTLVETLVLTVGALLVLSRVAPVATWPSRKQHLVSWSVAACVAVVVCLEPLVLFGWARSWLVASADTGQQQGRLGASGQIPLCNGFSAELSVITGGKLSPDGYDVETHQNMIYFLTGFPGASFAAEEYEDAEYTCTSTNIWKTPTNLWTTSLTWDRRTDVVSSGGRDFPRSNGNVFVFTRDASGQAVCRQLPTLGPAAGCQETISHIRRYLPEDRFVEALLAELHSADESVALSNSGLREQTNQPSLLPFPSEAGWTLAQMAQVGRLKADYQAALNDATNSIPYAVEFARLFPGAMNGISYYTGAVGDPRWFSKIGLHGRYLLRIILPIKLSADRRSIVSMGDPLIIDLTELSTPILNANGTRTFSVRRVAQLSPEDWKRLTAANGDFTALGIRLETNGPPVEGFDEAWGKF